SGEAMEGEMLSVAKVLGAWIEGLPDEIEDPEELPDKCRRWDLRQIPWGQRNDLFCGKKSGFIALHPNGTEFVFSPVIDDTQVLKIETRSKRRDFDDSDEVPFTDEMAEAVNYRVHAHISRVIDGDLQLHDSLMGSYIQKRS